MSAFCDNRELLPSSDGRDAPGPSRGIGRLDEDRLRDLPELPGGWDDHREAARLFLSWCAAVGPERLRNRLDLVAFDSDKRYLADVDRRGERTLDFVAGEPSHVLRKRAVLRRRRGAAERFVRAVLASERRVTEVAGSRSHTGLTRASRIAGLARLSPRRRR